MRKHKNFGRSEGIKSARLVVIASEGRCTEGIYFEAIKRHMCAQNVHMEILNRENNNSSPQSVYDQIDDYKNKYDVNDEDQLWMVIDRDKWPERTLSELAEYCYQDGNLNFCVSNPCFELWLIIHIEDVNSYSDEERRLLEENKKVSRRGDTWTKHKLKRLLGHYQESDYEAESLLHNVNVAITRAERLDVIKGDRWPQTIGTRVYLLVKSIMDI